MQAQVQQPFDGEKQPPPDPENKDTYERMMFEEIPYLCTIPHVAPPEAAENTTKSPEEAQQELARASDRGWQLLGGMKDGSCLYYAAGWWVYSFCYDDGIKQFHPLPPGTRGVPLFPPQEDKGIASYVLGKFDAPSKESSEESSAQAKAKKPEIGSGETKEAVPKEEVDGAEPKVESTDTTPKDLARPPTLQTRGETNFLVQKLEGGTTCDLTGKPRRVEVQFHCNPGSMDRINMIKETSTCSYLMIIHTPRLCNDVAFQPQQIDKPNLITCQEIVSEDGVEEWKSWKADEVRETLAELEQRHLQSNPGPEGQIPPPPPAPLIIGGIEVGGQQLVGGSPERTIKASKIITGGAKASKDEKFLATLARYDGKTTTVMSDKEMDKLGLKAVKEDAAKYREKLVRAAPGGVPWKLELWRTDKGEEFRMFIGVEEEEEEEARKKDAKQTNEVDEKDDPDGKGSEEEYKDEP